MDHEQIGAYQAALADWAATERVQAEKADRAGDERSASIHKMRLSMLTDGMLRALGERPLAMAAAEREFARRAEVYRERGDLDMADRVSAQMSLLTKARALVGQLEEGAAWKR